MRQSGEQDRLAVELLFLSFKPAAALLALGQGAHFSCGPRDTANKDPRGTQMLLWGESRSSFLFAPGSGLCFSINDFALQHSHSSSRRWFHCTTSLILPEPDSQRPLSDASHSELAPLLRGPNPSSGEPVPSPPSNSPVLKFPHLNNSTSSMSSASLGATSCSLQLLPPSYLQGPCCPQSSKP